MYDLALKTLKEHPYKKIDKESRNLDAEDAREEIEDYCEENSLKYVYFIFACLQLADCCRRLQI